MVIGRVREKEKLERALLSTKSELLAVYGRRRVGKTFLIRKIYKDHFVFDLTGLHNGKVKEQLINFDKKLKQRSKRFNKTKTPKNWFEGFDLLEKYLSGLKSKKKKVIFIDEFPWLATPRSNFLMLFENFWNDYCTKRNDLVVVVCGSAAAYMVQNIILNRGGLHNRLSQKIRLDPFTLAETELYLKSKKLNLSRYSIIQLYMALGGIPFYLEKIIKGESVVQNIDRLCFEPGGDLVNEFDEVFRSLFKNSRFHETIIKGLAKSQKGVTRSVLLKACKLPSNGVFTRALTELMDSGFAIKYTPYDKKGRESLYRLTDEFSAFHLKFMENNKNQGKGTWAKLSSKPSNVIWSSFAFETMCLKHIDSIKKSLKIEGIYSSNSSWTNGKAQVDLVIARDDGRINLCEMKFHNQEFELNKKDYLSLRNKLGEFKKATKYRGQVTLTMITTFGAIKNSYYLELVENDFDMNCLFE